MNKANGFIVIHRKILEWEWYGDINTKVLFLHLLLTANHEDGRFQGREVKRGELITSLPNLAEETTLTIRQTRTALEHLISTGEVTNKSFNKYRLISIVNYDLYQDKRQTKRQTNDRQPTDKTADNRQQYNNNNNITIKTNSTLTGTTPADDPFSRFWTAYPRKEAKQAAKKAFEKLKPDEGLLDTMLKAIERFKGTQQWQEDGGRYIPHPATWINQRRWEDEMNGESARGSGSSESPKSKWADFGEQLVL